MKKFLTKEDPIRALSKLGRGKLKGKSISELKKEARKEIVDFGNKKNLLRSFGVLKDSKIKLNEVERNMKEFRKEFDRRELMD